MGLGGPLGQDGLEQDLTDPFTDPLIAGKLLEHRVVVLGHLGADRPCTKSRHDAALPYVVVTPWNVAALLERRDPAKYLKTNGAL